jgi:hypothetical protein
MTACRAHTAIYAAVPCLVGKVPFTQALDLAMFRLGRRRGCEHQRCSRDGYKHADRTSHNDRCASKRFEPPLSPSLAIGLSASNPLVFTNHSGPAPPGCWTAFVVRVDPQRLVQWPDYLIEYGWHRWRWRLWLRTSHADGAAESYHAHTGGHQSPSASVHRAPSVCLLPNDWLSPDYAASDNLWSRQNEASARLLPPRSAGALPYPLGPDHRVPVTNEQQFWFNRRNHGYPDLPFPNDAADRVPDGLIDGRNMRPDWPVHTVSAVTPMVVGRAAVLAVCLGLPVTIAPLAWADPDPAPAPAVAAAAPAPAVAAPAPLPADAVPAPPPADAAPPADDGRVPSGDPATTKTPDGWTLTVKSKDETLLPVAPLTTAVSSREYLASGTFIGSLIGPGEPRGILEVGYEIGCGIDMSTSNGVSLTGTAGLSPSLGAGVPLIRMPTVTALPGIGASIGGAITVGLKPGIINVIPVDKKDFKGPDPWVMISGFHVKIDGCVGQSFIRSYATLTRQTDQSDVVLSYVGVTKAV